MKVSKGYKCSDKEQIRGCQGVEVEEGFIIKKQHVGIFGCARSVLYPDCCHVLNGMFKCHVLKGIYVCVKIHKLHI